MIEINLIKYLLNLNLVKRKLYCIDNAYAVS